MSNVSTKMKHDVDPREAILQKVGDISGFEICNNEVLIAIYRRPEKTIGGIVLPKSNLDEDLYQSKASLVLKIGPSCDFPLVPISLHDWVLIRPGDTYALEVNTVSCRLVYDKHIRAKISSPELVW